jgi:hypothetical protein
MNSERKIFVVTLRELPDQVPAEQRLKTFLKWAGRLLNFDCTYAIEKKPIYAGGLAQSNGADIEVITTKEGNGTMDRDQFVGNHKPTPNQKDK